MVEHIGYLYRDWGWPGSDYRENDAPLAQLLELLGDRRLGRVLVLGAGACGLAHALHQRGDATETVAVDIDPYLLVPASAILRGARLRLTEAALGVVDAAEVSRTWTLQSPHTLASDTFHCVFADGLRPPFANASFDTILTPWFIDQVPRDLSAFIAELSRLLRPGGHWLNQGPLIYPEQTPFDRRYAAPSSSTSPASTASTPADTSSPPSPTSSPRSLAAAKSNPPSASSPPNPPSRRSLHAGPPPAAPQRAGPPVPVHAHKGRTASRAHAKYLRR